MTVAAIEMVDVNKWYGDFHVLKDINLTVGAGEKVVICGPSGSGKSTVVRCINKLEEHQRGTIRLEGTELTNDPRSIAAIQGEIGMVFQQFNLFPHLSVLENLNEGMTMVVVTHEMGFARKVADKMVFIDEGRIMEQDSPEAFFSNPKTERCRTFLGQILQH